MIFAAAVLGVASIGLAATSTAAPYPPSDPCSVNAVARGVATADGTGTYDVVGSGLGSTQPVRVILASTGQELGRARTDDSGSFRTVVTAPFQADTTAPGLTASSPKQTCTWTPPAPPTSSPTPSPPVPTGSDTSSPASSGGAGAPGAGGENGTTSGGGATGSTNPADRTGSATSAPATSSAGPGDTATSSPPFAGPFPGTDTPFGIGLGIAAILLVLGTLAVLLLTRRPER